MLCIVKECLNNIVKHASAQGVVFTLQLRGQWICLSVVDDGQGFVRSVEASGNGLRNIRERVELLNGNVQIRSGPAKGTEIYIEIPF